ncbi:unnamed protein product [Gadus morhua 'NCC']
MGGALTTDTQGQEEQSRRGCRALWALLSLLWEQSGAESKCGPGARVCQPTQRQPDFMLDIAAVEPEPRDVFGATDEVSVH